jgi:hypothetical protein
MYELSFICLLTFQDLVEILLPTKIEKYLSANQALLLEEAFEVSYVEYSN